MVDSVASLRTSQDAALSESLAGTLLFGGPGHSVPVEIDSAFPPLWYSGSEGVNVSSARRGRVTCLSTCCFPCRFGDNGTGTGRTEQSYHLRDRTDSLRHCGSRF